MYKNILQASPHICKDNVKKFFDLQYFLSRITKPFYDLTQYKNMLQLINTSLQFSKITLIQE